MTRPSMRLASGSPSSRRAWIEILTFNWGKLTGNESPSSRRAWIEILRALRAAIWASVALLAEGVDRNLTLPFFASLTGVALLAEGVDRNLHQQNRA